MTEFFEQFGLMINYPHFGLKLHRFSDVLNDLEKWAPCPDNALGLNLSNQQIAAELEVDPDDVQVMTTQLREGIAVKKSRFS